MQIFGMTIEEFNKLSSFEQAKLRHKHNLFSLSDDELTIEQFENDNQNRLLNTIKNSYSMYENATSGLNILYVDKEAERGTLCPDDCAEYEPIITFIDNMTIDTKSLEHRLTILQTQKKQLLLVIADIKRLQDNKKNKPWNLALHEFDYDDVTYEVIPYKNQLSDLEKKLAQIEYEIVAISKSLSIPEPSQLTEDTIEEVEPSIFTYLLKETTTQHTYCRTIQTH
ncbi:MAG: hypothetical protein U9N59_04000 [Campylobacterota bacterium]|nr:hypothetical protein [Campylobacterota bacterium]